MAVFEFITVYGLWYAVPPLKGGTTYGQCTIHRCASSSHGVPGFDEFDARRVSPARLALRGGVSGADGRVASRWETPHRPPVYGVPELPPAEPGRSAVLHPDLPEDLRSSGGARALVRDGPVTWPSITSRSAPCRPCRPSRNRRW